MPTFRKLKGYAFDPSFSSTIGKRQSNQVVYKVRWEEINAENPFGEYIDIIDYDPSLDVYYDLINLNDREVLADHGLDPTEGNPKFHQQQVYAVVMSVISQFENALGRKIIWSRRYKVDDSTKYEYISKLRIYPHAIRQQNAYYSPEKLALLFGYFEAANNWGGNNIPGLAIFTCLSPDIVAHEVTHAIIDSMHPYWRFPTNPDMLAFHEGFSDIIALLQRFTFTNVVEDQIRSSKGDLLSTKNLLGDLAIQFGQAISPNRRALRSFLVSIDDKGEAKAVEPDPQKYYSTEDPHSRGAILVAAIFDAFTRLYKYQIADLLRIASNGTGILAQGDISPDLVKRLSDEAREIATKLLSVCIRAIDYCPPLDLTFGDYLRALITADIENNPDEEKSLRFALLEAFRSWGIVPLGINTFSVDSLVWKPLDNQLNENKIVGNEKFNKMKLFKQAIKYIFDPEENKKINSRNLAINSIEKILRENNREKIYQNYNLLAAEVHRIFNSKFDFFRDDKDHQDIEKLIGMSFNEIKYYINSTSEKNIIRAPKRQTATGDGIFQVYKCVPVIRHNQKDGTPSKLMIITLLQKVYVDLSNSDFKGYFPNNQYSYRGGATLIIDLSNFEIKYAIIKDITDSKRLNSQIDFTISSIQNEADSALMMKDSEPFAALHIH
ncbi:hypothetical protein VB776_07620 [Arcicella sp. DC2W]|uniref:Peptidase M4 n=1 Tax=Arcicella gelida TaxID=2984195 RepID=A0ABU5S2R2_9BACT|nr:hypothetical protein [Arcicella sp. DC2W]MEA5402777.1 hypothetical protein [Arcicella sp. DC2W]